MQLAKMEFFQSTNYQVPITNYVISIGQQDWSKIPGFKFWVESLEYVLLSRKYRQKEQLVKAFWQAREAVGQR